MIQYFDLYKNELVIYVKRDCKSEYNICDLSNFIQRCESLIFKYTIFLYSPECDRYIEYKNFDSYLDLESWILENV